MKKHPCQERSLLYCDFHIHIFVSGYPTQGESVLILFQDRESVFYSIVIDSYVQKTGRDTYQNKTDDLLQRFGVSRLSLLCWTHPHHDHSAGMDKIIEKYCDDYTRFIFPTHIENNAGDIVDLKAEDKYIIDQILEINRSKKLAAIPMDVHDYETRWVDTVRINDLDGVMDSADVEIDIMSPNASILASYINESLCNPNSLSLSLLISVNNYGFFFGGDLINAQIERMDHSVLSNCRFVKIPHHGSDSAKDLIQHLPSQGFDNACTTTYYPKKLPLKSILDMYMEKCEHLYATSDVHQGSVPVGDGGVIEFDFYLFETPPRYSAILSGSSIEYK